MQAGTVPPPPRPEGGSVLQRRIAGIPVPVLFVGIVVGAYLWLRHKQNAAASSSATTGGAQAPTCVAVDQFGNCIESGLTPYGPYSYDTGGYGGYGYGGVTGQQPVPTPNPPTPDMNTTPTPSAPTPAPPVQAPTLAPSAPTVVGRGPTPPGYAPIPGGPTLGSEMVAAGVPVKKSGNAYFYPPPDWVRVQTPAESRFLSALGYKVETYGNTQYYNPHQSGVRKFTPIPPPQPVRVGHK